MTNQGWHNLPGTVAVNGVSLVGGYTDSFSASAPDTNITAIRTTSSFGIIADKISLETKLEGLDFQISDPGRGFDVDSGAFTLSSCEYIKRRHDCGN